MRSYPSQSTLVLLGFVLSLVFPAGRTQAIPGDGQGYGGVLPRLRLTHVLTPSRRTEEWEILCANRDSCELTRRSSGNILAKSHLSPAQAARILEPFLAKVPAGAGGPRAGASLSWEAALGNQTSRGGIALGGSPSPDIGQIAPVLSLELALAQEEAR
jgi:hypothetical protein